MLANELETLVANVQKLGCEGQTIELKKAEKGTPEHLYDTLSSFSNQDNGGIILFGVDEEDAYAVCGVYNAQDLQKHVAEQCEQMEPVVRPLFTVCSINDKTVVSAEIAPCTVFDRPCFYKGKGRMKGSYIRVGEADKPMTEYEVYSYEAFKRKLQDELRVDPRADMKQLNPNLLQLYYARIKQEKPNLAANSEIDILHLQGMAIDQKPTVAGEMIFGVYPQSLFPQYSVIASVVPGTRIGALGEEGERFTDDKRIEGTLSQMLEEGVAFVARNMKTSVIVDEYGRRADKAEYPLKAIREALLNALVHRDYSLHTENAPIRLLLFSDRLEIENPGGLYGRGTLEQLGNAALDVRNPYIAGALEVFLQSENRYSGVPTMRREMQRHGLLPPKFESQRGLFRVTFYNTPEKNTQTDLTQRILAFCRTPRSRAELAEAFDFQVPTYFLNTYIKPLIEQGMIELGLPDKPKSKNQTYHTVSLD